MAPFKENIRKAQKDMLSLNLGKVDPSVSEYIRELEQKSKVPSVFPDIRKYPEGFEGVSDMCECMPGASMKKIIDWAIESRFLIRNENKDLEVHPIYEAQYGPAQHETMTKTHAKSWHKGCVKTYLPRKLTDLIKGAWSFGKQGVEHRKVMSNLSKRSQTHG